MGWWQGASTVLNDSQSFGPEHEGTCPHKRTYAPLLMALRRLSETNRNMIRFVAGHQVHAGEVAAAASLMSELQVYRCKELEKQQLLHVDNSTDKRYWLHNAL